MATSTNPPAGLFRPGWWLAAVPDRLGQPTLVKITIRMMTARTRAMIEIVRVFITTP
jgi:hypothetical protein